MTGRLLRPATLRQLLFYQLQWQQSRQFLSASYQCNDAWTKRLGNSLVSSINLGDFFYDLNRKYKHEGKVSAIDVDLYVNRIDNPKDDVWVDEVEELVRCLRRSPETSETLESTHYAVTRALLDGGHTTAFLQLLTDPMTYGLFPDHLTCNLLMDTFLERQEYTAAARVASYLMLQEDFGPPLTQALTLAACYRYLTTENNLPWEDYRPKVEEPEEEVKIRVQYLRNPYFDDHFHLTKPHYLVGKTLAWLSPLVGGVVGRSCEVWGWALYNKWEQLEAALNKLKTDNESVASFVISEVKSIVEKLEDEDVRGRLLSAITILESAQSLVVDVDLCEAINKMVQDAAKEAEPVDIEAQKENYRRWEEQRETEYQKQVEAYRKKQLLKEIEEKKKDLASKEEVIYFFNNKEKLELLLPPRKQYFPKRYKGHKRKPKQVDEAYVPPTV